VLARGTAHGIAYLAPYVAGKTGTTDGENDAWFVGFTNEVTVAVWVGYDNADGKRRTLGGGQTGASVAVPIFEPIIQAVWTHHAPKTVLAPPSPEAKRELVAVRSDDSEGEYATAGRGTIEYLRRDRSGQVSDTRYQLVSPRDYGISDPRYGGDPGYPGYGGDPRYGANQFEPWIRRWDSQPSYGAQPQPRGGLFGWQQPPPQPRYDDPRSRARGRNGDVFIERE
jgi:hypothetical protein